MILHIPHSSVDTNFITVENEQVNINLLTDLYTDELFDFNTAVKVIFPYNRMVVDVERFKNDAMEKYGKGYIYKTDYFNNLIKREIVNFELIYDNYHRIFNNTINEYLSLFPIAFIVDCHSFPNIPFPWENDVSERPDICIGTTDSHTPLEIIDPLVKYFNSYNLTVNINNPYNGTIIPSDFINRADEVHSIMIEVNRKLYLDNKYHKNSLFNDIKKMINGALKIIDEWTNETENGFWGCLH